ncbi:hypothetical protein M1446_01220 [Candidatus Dependentiae bacterium]|nr:hypothetical protein [Candidatus Dependentiae bacterium]
MKLSSKLLLLFYLFNFSANATVFINKTGCPIYIYYGGEQKFWLFKNYFEINIDDSSKKHIIINIPQLIRGGTQTRVVCLPEVHQDDINIIKFSADSDKNEYGIVTVVSLKEIPIKLKNEKKILKKIDKILNDKNYQVTNNKLESVIDIELDSKNKSNSFEYNFTLNRIRRKTL